MPNWLTAVVLQLKSREVHCVMSADGLWLLHPEGWSVMLCNALLQLVNVQSNSEFASHMLNRDVWRDDTVRNIIKVGFILYQVSSACMTRPEEEQAPSFHVH